MVSGTREPEPARAADCSGQPSCLQPTYGRDFVDEGCGGAGNDDNFECVLAPLSSTCSIADAADYNSVYHPRLPSINQEYVGPVRCRPLPLP